MNHHNSNQTNNNINGNEKKQLVKLLEQAPSKLPIRLNESVDMFLDLNGRVKEDVNFNTKDSTDQIKSNQIEQQTTKIVKNASFNVINQSSKPILTNFSSINSNSCSSLLQTSSKPVITKVVNKPQILKAIPIAFTIMPNTKKVTYSLFAKSQESQQTVLAQMNDDMATQLFEIINNAVQKSAEHNNESIQICVPQSQQNVIKLVTNSNSNLNQNLPSSSSTTSSSSSFVYQKPSLIQISKQNESWLSSAVNQATTNTTNNNGNNNSAIYLTKQNDIVSQLINSDDFSSLLTTATANTNRTNHENSNAKSSNNQSVMIEYVNTASF